MMYNHQLSIVLTHTRTHTFRHIITIDIINMKQFIPALTHFFFFFFALQLPDLCQKFHISIILIYTFVRGFYARLVVMLGQLLCQANYAGFVSDKLRKVERRTRDTRAVDQVLKVVRTSQLAVKFSTFFFLSRSYDQYTSGPFMSFSFLNHGNCL